MTPVIDILKMVIHGIGICMKYIDRLAIPIPTVCIMSEKSLAHSGSILNTSVITGKATAPPPSEVAPAINDPNTMVRDMNQLSLNRLKL